MKVLLSIVCILALVLIIPIGLVFEYDESGFSYYIKALFFKFKINKPKEQHSKAQKKEKKGGDLKAFTAFIEPIVKTAGKLIKLLSVNKLILNLTLATEDAFTTAMLYGSTAASVGMIFPFLNNNIKIKKQYISINADFGSSKSVLCLYADISIQIWQILILSAYFLYKYIRKLHEERICKNG